MIYIRKNNTNDITLELTDVSQPTQTFYLFGFTFQGTNVPTPRYYTSPDLAIGTQPDRFNRFSLVESGVGSSSTFVNNAPMRINAGQYIYEVWASSAPITSGSYPGVILQPPVSSGHMVVFGGSPVGNPVYNGMTTIPTTPNVYL